MSHIENTSVLPEDMDDSAAPITGMSIFSIAAGYKLPKIHHQQTRLCSGKDLPPPYTTRHRCDPCATFNGKSPGVRHAVAKSPAKSSEVPPRTSELKAIPSDTQYFSIAEAIKTAPMLYLRPIEERPALSQPEKKGHVAKAKDRIKMVFNGPINKTKGPIVVSLPEAYDLEQLCAWHEEREGHQPQTDSITPVWIKQGNGRWGHAANTTWPELFAPLLEKIESLKRELDELQTQHLKNWSHDGAHPS